MSAGCSCAGVTEAHEPGDASERAGMYAIRQVEKIYNQERLHLALGYRPPLEFQRSLQPLRAQRTSMSFSGHQEICRSDGEIGEAGNGSRRRRSPRSSAATSFQSAIPWQVSPAEPASASTTGNDSQQPNSPPRFSLAQGEVRLGVTRDRHGL